MSYPTSPVPDAQLGADGLDLGYQGRTVVHDAGTTLRAGQVVALAGPNGSGESTLLRTSARLHRPDAGTVRLGDASGELDALALNHRDVARRVTMLARSRPTPARLSVRDVVGFGRHP